MEIEKLSLTDQGKLYEFVSSMEKVVAECEQEGTQMLGTKETIENIKYVLRGQHND